MSPSLEGAPLIKVSKLNERPGDHSSKYGMYIYTLAVHSRHVATKPL